MGGRGLASGWFPRVFASSRARSFGPFAFVASLGAMLAAAPSVSCYSTDDGTPPPLDHIYFPVGLQVSAGGSVLYAVNSDFDLQYSGGTLQSYDLRLIRRHALAILADPNSPDVPVLERVTTSGACPGDPPVSTSTGGRQPLGETCAPPVDSSFYVRDTAVIGAFATGMLRSLPPADLVPSSARVPGESLKVGSRRFDRLFVPVRGNASLTWASVERDSFDSVPPDDPKASYAPFTLSCGKDAKGRCDAAHMAGENASEPGNTRGITMPGEPFGIAASEDGEFVVITHQSDTKTSLFATGLSRDQDDAAGASTDTFPVPSLQFVVSDVVVGGVGISAVPHDRDAFLGSTQAFPRNAYLQTSRLVAQVDLLRSYPDEFGGSGSSLRRPFLERERSFPIALGPSGTDSRGIVIDPSPRIACKANVRPAASGRTQADVDRDLVACARKPARVFVANRSPASLLVGDVGAGQPDGTYDPDDLRLHTTIPLTSGPSNLYLAPIVDRDGAYALRVFVVCFDSSTIFVIDPDSLEVENVLHVGAGPYAMTFDPFTLEDVATHQQVPMDGREPASSGLRRYRFAYVASFTNSFVQLIDLDNAQADRSTFERVVFTLGRPTAPKGS